MLSQSTSSVSFYFDRIKKFEPPAQQFAKSVIIESQGDDSVIGVNIGQSFCMFFVSQTSKRVINLIAKVNSELLESTRSASIE